MNIKSSEGTRQIKPSIRIVIFKANSSGKPGREKSKSLTLEDTDFDSVSGLLKTILLDRKKTIIHKLSDKPGSTTVSIIKDQGTSLSRSKTFTLYYTSITEVYDFIVEAVAGNNE